MTPEHAKALLPLITAFVAGKKIQFRASRGDQGWQDIETCEFKFRPDQYRIKPLHHPDISFSPDGNLLPPRVGEWACKKVLSEASIPEGHRPYVKGEKPREGDMHQYSDGKRKPIEFASGMKAGSPEADARGTAFTLAPLPEPKLIPLTSEELPSVVWVRRKVASRMRHVLLVTTWDMETGSFWYKIADGSVQIKPEHFHEWEFSPNRKTWHPLVKEVLA